jgi:CshA-type fibril repeat protein
MNHRYSFSVLSMLSVLFVLTLTTPAFAQPTTDTDNDGITDVNDLDDDNDGILDINEGCGSLTTNEAGGTFDTTSVPKNLATAPGAGYTYATFNTAAGQYAVISQASPNWHPTPSLWDYAGHTTGAPNDAFLAVNGSTTVGTFYSEVLSLTASTSYNFSMWHASAFNTVLASGYNLQLQVRRVSDDSLIASASTGIQFTIGWKPLSLSFSAPTTGNYTVSLINVSVQAGGNDFAIDDIRFIPFQCTQDTDNDGQPDVIDNDSDNDGCPDALEGGMTFQLTNIDTNGRLTGSVDADGIPILAGSGQPVNASTDSLVANACTPPVTTNDQQPYTPGTIITINILTNDTTGDPGLATSVALVGADTGTNGKVKTVPGEGTWTVNVTTGALTFTPEGGFSGLPTSVQYTVTDSDGNVSNVATVTLTVPLPIGLLRFDAIKEEGSAKLIWETTNEINCDRFEIESQNGKGEWSKKGIIYSKANGVATTTYFFYDVKPETGINLYRLRIVDKDGSSTYSPVARLEFNATTAITLWPNPINDYAFIQGLNTPSKVTIINTSGNIVQQTEQFKGTKLDVSALSGGLYFIKITSPQSAPVTLKFVKQ